MFHALLISSSSSSSPESRPTWARKPNFKFSGFLPTLSKKERDAELTNRQCACRTKFIFRQDAEKQPSDHKHEKAERRLAPEVANQENTMLSSIAITSLSGSGSSAPIACSMKPSIGRYFSMGLPTLAKFMPILIVRR